MNPERWRRVEELLDAALDLPPADREAFLQQECRDIPEMAAEVLAILEAGERPAEMLDRPAAHVASVLTGDGPTGGTVPDRIGPYRIERVIGQGGMGTVYLAHRDDGEFQQRVALKVVRRGLHLDPRIVRRFRDERQILAGLTHPGIARLLDGGLTEDGLPYFAMEYVDGAAIDRYCDRRGLSVDERLQLFLRVCDALAHAHERQIVHRDIKPSNILVTEAGDPRLLDFGIAKLLGGLDDAPGAAPLTRQSERLLTPEYASPEQIRGDPVVIASDVYCLGVLLYELLTGQRPFRRGERSAHELERAVLEEDPTRPSEAATREPLRRRLKGDLDTIVLTAMAKEPERRYASADAMAADVRRHLAGQPVSARGSSPVYRVWRWTSRHRAAVRSAVAFSLLAAAVATVVARARMPDRSDTGPTAAGPADGRTAPRGPMIAVLPFKHIGRADQQYFTDGLVEEVTSRLAGLSGLGVISRTSADLYRNTTAPLKQIGAELGAQYVLEGSVRWVRGDSGWQVRVTPQLIRVSDDTHLWTENFDVALTEVLRVQGRIAELVAAALDVALDAPERSGLTAEPTRNPEAYSQFLRGNEAFNRGFARADLLTAIGHFESAITEDRDFAIAWARLAQAHLGMYWFGHERVSSRLDRARAAIDQALRRDPRLAEAQLALGYYYYWGFRDYPRALEALQAVRARAPSNSHVLAALARVERRTGQWEDAIRHYREALELDPRSSGFAHDLGDTYLSVRNFPEAERLFDRAIALAPGRPLPYVYKASLYMIWRGDFAAAGATLREALTHMEPGQLAAEVLSWERLSASIVTADSALATTLGEVTLAGFPGDSARFYLLKAELLNAAGEPLGARTYADSARAVLAARLEQAHDDRQSHAPLGLAYAMLGRREDAIRAGRRATELVPLSEDANSGPSGVTNLARIHVLLGEPVPAIDLLQSLLAVPSWISKAALQSDPVWKPLWSHPRFRKMIEAGT